MSREDLTDILTSGPLGLSERDVTRVVRLICESRGRAIDFDMLRSVLDMSSGVWYQATLAEGIPQLVLSKPVVVPITVSVVDILNLHVLSRMKVRNNVGVYFRTLSPKVRLQLGDQVFETSVQLCTMTPHWNRSFTFHCAVPAGDLYTVQRWLTSVVLRISLYDVHSEGRVAFGNWLCAAQVSLLELLRASSVAFTLRLSAKSTVSTIDCVSQETAGSATGTGVGDMPGSGGDGGITVKSSTAYSAFLESQNALVEEALAREVKEATELAERSEGDDAAASATRAALARKRREDKRNSGSKGDPPLSGGPRSGPRSGSRGNDTDDDNGRGHKGQGRLADDLNMSMSHRMLAARVDADAGNSSHRGGRNGRSASWARKPSLTATITEPSASLIQKTMGLSEAGRNSLTFSMILSEKKTAVHAQVSEGAKNRLKAAMMNHFDHGDPDTSMRRLPSWMKSKEKGHGMKEEVEIDRDAYLRLAAGAVNLTLSSFQMEQLFVMRRLRMDVLRDERFGFGVTAIGTSLASELRAYYAMQSGLGSFVRDADLLPIVFSLQVSVEDVGLSGLFASEETWWNLLFERKITRELNELGLSTASNIMGRHATATRAGKAWLKVSRKDPMAHTLPVSVGASGSVLGTESPTSQVPRRWAGSMSSATGRSPMGPDRASTRYSALGAGSPSPYHGRGRGERSARGPLGKSFSRSRHRRPSKKRHNSILSNWSDLGLHRSPSVTALSKEAMRRGARTTSFVDSDDEGDNPARRGGLSFSKTGAESAVMDVVAEEEPHLWMDMLRRMAEASGSENVPKVGPYAYMTVGNCLDIAVRSTQFATYYKNVYRALQLLYPSRDFRILGLDERNRYCLLSQFVVPVDVLYNAAVWHPILACQVVSLLGGVSHLDVSTPVASGAPCVPFSCAIIGATKHCVTTGSALQIANLLSDRSDSTMLPPREVLSEVPQVRPVTAVIKSQVGTRLERAILLCCIFVGMGLDAYVACGNRGLHECYWVIVKAKVRVRRHCKTYVHRLRHMLAATKDERVRAALREELNECISERDFSADLQLDEVLALYDNYRSRMKRFGRRIDPVLLEDRRDGKGDDVVQEETGKDMAGGGGDADKEETVAADEDVDKQAEKGADKGADKGTDKGESKDGTSSPDARGSSPKSEASGASADAVKASEDSPVIGRVKPASPFASPLVSVVDLATAKSATVLDPLATQTEGSELLDPEHKDSTLSASGGGMSALTSSPQDTVGARQSPVNVASAASSASAIPTVLESDGEGTPCARRSADTTVVEGGDGVKEEPRGMDPRPGAGLGSILVQDATILEVMQAVDASERGLRGRGQGMDMPSGADMGMPADSVA